VGLTDAQYKSLVVLQVGDSADGVLASNIDLLWLKNDDRADSYTRFLYTKRDAIDTIMASVRGKVSFKARVGQSLGPDEELAADARRRAGADRRAGGHPERATAGRHHDHRADYAAGLLAGRERPAL
jgi:hypothetical protein